MGKIGSFGLTGLNFKTDDKFRKWKREITWGNCFETDDLSGGLTSAVRQGLSREI